MTDSPALFKSVMLTGHRSFAPADVRWLEHELYKTVRRLKEFHGVEELISGMALGADTIWAEAAVALEVPLAAYIPFEVQPDRWPARNQQVWRELRAKAAREVVVGPNFSIGLLHARNDAMIRDSDLCVAAFRTSETKGGTYSAVQKLRKLQKPLIIIDPETRTVSKEHFPIS
jgi:uncharacterized phage-like protein YoqJ